MARGPGAGRGADARAPRGGARPAAPRGGRTKTVAVITGVVSSLLALAGPFLPVRAALHAAWAPAVGLGYSVELDPLAAIFVAVVGIVFAAGLTSSDRAGHARVYHALLCVLLA